MTTELTLTAEQYSVPRPAALSYRIHHTDAATDEAWDSFLVQTPGGHHVQTSLWAQVKATLGWRAVRVIVTQEGKIVAGAQVLLRSLPLLGAVGYVAKGPLFAKDDPALRRMLYEELKQVARHYRIQQLIVQPPAATSDLPEGAAGVGFHPSAEPVATTTTLLIDLSKDEETLLAAMKPRTRYNLRLSQRKGITVREGGEGELEIYHRLLSATGQRQGFSVYPPHYFIAMWRLLNPQGFINLLLAEYEGSVVSAQLAIPFGDTVLNKLSVWSGDYGEHRPNEALQWASIRWAKTHGYRWYDFEGIDLATAQVVLDGATATTTPMHTVTTFKLGFGGEIATSPGAYSYLYNPLFRWGYETIFPKIAQHSGVERLLNYVRTH
jgi:peptidoglycan pentaglycine glycine transferase (the first glycine)